MLSSSSASATSTISTASSSYVEDQGPILKFLLLGESSVGKSSILHRFISQYFSPSQIPTIGVDVSQAKTLFIGKRQSARVQITDTAGLEKFRFTSQNVYRGSHAIILVYDVTCRFTFDRISEYWIPELVEKYPKSTEHSKLILLGNKVDLLNASTSSVFINTKKERQVSIEEAQELANSKNMKFMEISVKKSTNIDHIFTDTIREILREQKENNERHQSGKHPRQRNSFGSRVSTAVCLHLNQGRQRQPLTPRHRLSLSFDFNQSPNQLMTSSMSTSPTSTPIVEQEEWDPVKNYASRNSDKKEKFQREEIPIDMNDDTFSSNNDDIPSPIVTTALANETKTSINDDGVELRLSPQSKGEATCDIGMDKLSISPKSKLPDEQPTPSSITTIKLSPSSDGKIKRSTSSGKVHPHIQGMSLSTYTNSNGLPPPQRATPAKKKRFRFLRFTQRRNKKNTV